MKLLRRIFWGWVLLLIAIAVIGAAVYAGDPRAGGEIIRNGFLFVGLGPFIAVFWVIAVVAHEGHSSGVISGPQLGPIFLLIVFSAIFLGLIVGGTRSLYKKATGIFGGGGGGHAH